MSRAALAAVISILFARSAQAELELPRENPAAKVSQVVGLTEIAVEYTSPAVKGRHIWGEVVPYDRPWSISPGQPTLISFSRDVAIAGGAVPAGQYRLWAIPGHEQWTVVLSNWDPSGGRATKDGDIGQWKVKPRATTAPRERLTFLFADFTDEKASLELEWDKVRISLPIATNTTQQIQSSIGQLDSAWRSYANAARFMLEKKRDYDTGLRYADQSLALHDDWYTRWIKAGLHAAKHDYRAALEEGEHARELGQQLGSNFVLGPDLDRALADWRKRASGLHTAGTTSRN